jgi:magnesium transporter
MIKSYLLNLEGKFISNVPVAELPTILAGDGNFLWVDLFKATRDEIKVLSDVFKFHPLAIEDCTNVIHHPKIDNFEDYLFVVLHAPDFKRSPDKLRTTEIDFFLSKNYLVTYHEQPLKVISSLQEKCEKSADSVMGKGPDFLMYQIVDFVMDEKIENCINRIMKEPTTQVLEEIFSLKRGLLYLRRIIGPQRDTINRLTREEFHNIMPRTRIYFRDVYDRLIRIFDLIETYRDVIIGAQDAYLSAVSQKTNEVIKILAVVSTLIMPPTLIASIYGMNFKFMPELDWKLGYLVALGLMILSVAGMTYFMKRKKWF